MKNTNSVISVLLGLVVVFLLTCSLEPLNLTTETGVPYAFINNSAPQVSTSILDTTLFTICDTAHVGDTVKFLGTIIPPDSRIKNVQWNFADSSQDTNPQTAHIYKKSGIFQAVFTVFDAVGNSLTDSVSVCVNTPPDSIQILSPANGSTVQSALPVILSWKGYDSDIFDSVLTYTVVCERSNLTCDTIVRGTDTTSIVLTGNLLQEKQLSWFVIAQDRFGDVKSSAKNTFSVKSGDDARLSVLNVSAGTLNPKFCDSILFYDDSVPSTTTSITITAIARDISAKVSIKDTILDIGDSTQLITLVPDITNEIPVKVLSQNGLTNKIYTIRVIPVLPIVIPVPGDTIFLSSISLSAGKFFPLPMPLSDSLLQDTVSYSTTAITINAAANDSLATIVAGSSDTIRLRESSDPISLNYGTTEIPIRLTHHKGKPERNYTLSVFRPAIPDTLLSSLEVSAGTLRTVNAPVPDTLRDTVSFIDSVITITPSALDSQSSITVDSLSVKSSSKSPLINLQVGTTEIKIRVASLSGTKSKTYILFIVRKTDSTAPLTTPPSGVAANGISVSSIQIVWDDNVNATFYTIQKSIRADSGFTDISKPTSNSYIDTVLDSGTTHYYRVSASNSVGSTAYSSIVSATTFLKPFFTEQPQSRTAVEGTQAIFSASAEGIPMPAYSWQKNGIDINTTSSRCTTSVLSLADNNARFRCIARNEAGNVISNEVELTVDSMFTKPAIIQQPGDTEVFSGDTIILTITDTGSYLQRQWRKDGTDLPQAVSCTLSINGAEPADGGSYTVKVWNRNDSAVTAPFYLRVLPKGEAGLTAQARSASSIGVSWNSIDGAQWYRLLRASGSNAFASVCSTSQTSVIDTLLSEGISYSYKLTAGNNSGDYPTNDSVAATTWYGPRITTQPQPQRIIEGQTISLSVVATGLPACSYQWNKNGTPISGATLSSFSLTNSAPDDSGDYSVQLTNAVRVVNSSSAHVSVIPTYSLTTASVPAIGGTVVRSKIAARYERGDTVRLTARAASGYRFTGWSGDAVSGDSSVLVSMNKNTSISANFIRQFKLTLSSMAHGEVAPSGTGSVDSGAATAITATANAKYRFVVWRTISGSAAIDDSTDASTSIRLVNGDASVEGRFITTDTAWSTGCGKTFSTLTSGTYTVTSSGMNRSYNIDVPVDYDYNKPYRLIFGMHSMGSSAEKVAGTGTGPTADFYHLRPLAASSNIPCIFVAPQGNSDGTWDGSTDPVFFSDLLKLLKDTLCIDTTRVFCSGFSFGAMYTYALSLAYPTQLRAVACYAPANYNFTQPTDNHIPIAYYQTTGTTDGTCPWINSDLNKQGGKYCLLNHIEDNGCTVPSTIPLATSGIHVSTEFTDGLEGYPVKFSSFKGGHDCVVSDSGSSVNWIAEETWEFFMRF